VARDASDFMSGVLTVTYLFDFFFWLNSLVMCYTVRYSCLCDVCVLLSVELASKEVQHELDNIQRRLSEFLAAEENAVKERIRYNRSYEILATNNDETAFTDIICCAHNN